MTYTAAPATRMLATHCVVCGRPLVDARSVELGIGPECREHNDGGISEEAREQANALVFSAALAAPKGDIAKVMDCAQKIRDLGLTTLADKVERRFRKQVDKLTANPRRAKIQITCEENRLLVKTPYRRGDAKAFIDAWRAIPGRKFTYGKNSIPLSERPALWDLLRRFFPGEWGVGPKGPFRVPA